MRPSSLAFLAFLASFPASALEGAQQSAPRKPDKAIARTGAVDEAALLKSQKEQEAKAKAWDAKLHKTMQGVCRGC